MKRLGVMGIALFLFFAASFAVAVALGVEEGEQLLGWMEQLPEQPGGRWLIGLIVVGLLTVDLLLPIPSQPVMLAAGALLGTFVGGLVSAIGLQLAVMLGYGLCRFGGRAMFDRLVDAADRRRLDEGVKTYGLLTLAIVRGVPIIPEVLICLAGLARVSPWRFFALFALVNVPFAFLHAWAGAHSTWLQPWPALLVALGLPALAWIAHRKLRHTQSPPRSELTD
jgi:uncharacterized membrane protein YdjX (TVP38/TMEM64 family)